MISLRFLFLSVIAATTTLASHASAHFPWLIVNDDNQVVYFFGESIADRTYHLPAGIAEAKLFTREQGKLSAIETSHVDSDQLVGLRSKATVADGADVCAQATFGIYHGSRLEYYTQFLGRKLPQSFGDCQPLDAALQAHAVDTESGVDVYVLWQGKPLAGAEVKLFCDEGHEEAASKTDAKGRVAFTDQEVEEGLNGIVVGHKVADQSGTLNGQDYTAVSHYLTATFFDPEGLAPTKQDNPRITQSASSVSHSNASPSPTSNERASFAELPFGITSFGAARIGNAIYVYGGHTGSAHSYSNEGQSKQLLKLDLNHPTMPWQVVSEGERIQGLGMVAHKSRLISVGGFEARNKEGEEQDLHSLATVRAFDVNTQQWSDLPALPQGRSSHDVAVVGDKLFVVGGWMMDGEKETQWHTTALMMDLSATEPKWVEIATPGFSRRALALAAHRGQLYVMGGMNEDGGPTRAVEVYDPQSDTWIAGPELLGETGMDGFGASAWSVDGQLVSTTIGGDVQVLSEDGKQWELIGATRDARFFHRLLPLTNGSLISIGGASMESGKFLEPEVVRLK